MRNICLAILLAAPCAPGLAAGGVVGGGAVTYADAGNGGIFDFSFADTSGVVAAASNAGPVTKTVALSQSNAWINRIDIASAANAGVVYGSSYSSFAINQKVTGAPGTVAQLSYTFGVDGSFSPGAVSHYPGVSDVPAQNLSFYLIAYPGLALGLSTETDSFGTYQRFTTSTGSVTLSRFPGTPGYSSTIAPWLTIASLCAGADTRCLDGANFNDLVTVNLDMPVDTDYFVFGFLGSQTNGQVDFFNTAKLVSISLAPEFTLVSDDGGALARASDGTYSLAVPEPASWAMLIAGFGLVGAAMRRRAVVPA